MADGFSHSSGPESYDWYASAVTSLDHFAHDVGLGESAAEFDDVIFAPLVTGAVKGPHVIRLNFCHPVTWLRCSRRRSAFVTAQPPDQS